MPSKTNDDAGLSRGASDLLHALRAVFALSVLVSHCRQHLLVDYSALTEPNLAVKLFYFSTGFGSAAVTGFFVLSGYLITLRYLEALKRGTISPGKFLVTRAVRLYVVLLPVLLFSSLVVAQSSVRGDVSWPTLLKNVFFLQPGGITHFANNAPLWSLGYEAWCYVVFCGLTAGFFRWWRGERAAGLVWICAGAAPFVIFSVWMLHYFALWVAGGVAALFTRYEAHSRRADLRAKWLSYSCVALALVGFVAARLGAPAPYRDYLIAVPLAACLALLAKVEVVLAGPVARIGFFGSRLSYSLYLTHFTWVLWVESTWGGGRQPTGEGVGLVALVSLGCVAFAFGFSWLTERQTARVRSLLGAS